MARCARSRIRPQERRDRVASGREAELAKQPIQPAGDPTETRIVPQSGEQRRGDPRLRGVQLPRVQVEGARYPPPLAVPERRPRQRVRKNPKVRPTPRGYGHAPAPQPRRRALNQAAPWTFPPGRLAPPAPAPVPWTPHRGA